MARLKWKGPFVSKKVFNDKKKNLKITVKTVSRNSEIIPNYIGTSFNVYNGKKNSKIEVTEEMIGFKFGEFYPTRKKFSFKKSKKK